MKIISYTLISILFASVPLATAMESRLPPLIGALPMGTGGGEMQFGARKDGIRIGLSSESTTYRLNHRINVWSEFETENPLTDLNVVKENFLFITHPDGTVSKERGGWPIDGMLGASWSGGMSDSLHRLIRKPGVYKLQWKVGVWESQIISFKVIGGD